MGWLSRRKQQKSGRVGLYFIPRRANRPKPLQAGLGLGYKMAYSGDARSYNVFIDKKPMSVEVTYTTPSGEHADTISVGTWGNPYATIPAHQPGEHTEVKHLDGDILFTNEYPITGISQIDRSIDTNSYQRYLQRIAKEIRPVGTCGDIKLHDWSSLIADNDKPQTFTEYVATCGNTQRSRWACRGCEYVGECKGT